MSASDDFDAWHKREFPFYRVDSDGTLRSALKRAYMAGRESSATKMRRLGKGFTAYEWVCARCEWMGFSKDLVDGEACPRCRLVL